MKKIIEFTFLFILCFFFKVRAQDNPSKSQTKIVKLDLDKKTIEGPLPIDEFITLEITSKSNKIYTDGSSELIRFRYNKEKCKILYDSIKFAEAISSPDDKSLRKYAQKFKVEKKTNSTYTGTLQPYILPNSSYELIFRKILNTKQQKKFLKIIHHLAKNKRGEALDLYKKEFIQKEKYDDEDFRCIPIDNFPPFEFLEQMMPQIKAKINSISELEESTLKLTDQEIEYLGKKYIELEIEADTLTKVSIEFLNVINSGYSDIFKGLRTFSNDPVADTFDLIQIKENLNTSLKSINTVKKEIRKIIVLNPLDTRLKDIYDNKILKLIEVLKDNHKSIDKRIEDFFSLNLAMPQSNVNDSILFRKLENVFIYGEIITVNSVSSKDKDSGVKSLVADVGIINSLVSDQQGNTRYLGRLYFGLNWHIGGYNQKLRFNQIANKRKSYIRSLSLGVTVGEINEFGYRDLFNKISPALGFNYQVYENIRVGSGVLFLRNDRNPIVDNEPIAVRPYVNISFDLKILKDLAFFTTILGSQK